MSLETKMTILDGTSFSVGTDWFDDVPITGGTGYMSAILEVVDISNVKEITLAWRPIIKNDEVTPLQIETRWLPVFIDLKGGDSSDPNPAEIPEYAWAYQLSTADLGEDLNYYLYFVHPETPAAVPLIRDESGNHFGIELFVKAASNGVSPTFTFRINVLTTVES